MKILRQRCLESFFNLQRSLFHSRAGKKPGGFLISLSCLSGTVEKLAVDARAVELLGFTCSFSLSLSAFSFGANANLAPRLCKVRSASLLHSRRRCEHVFSHVLIAPFPQFLDRNSHLETVLAGSVSYTSRLYGRFKMKFLRELFTTSMKATTTHQKESYSTSFPFRRRPSCFPALKIRKQKRETSSSLSV